MKHFKALIILLLIIFFTISFGGSKNSASRALSTVPAPDAPVDSFQLLVDKAILKLAIHRALPGKENINDGRTKELLAELRNYSERIHGSRKVNYHNVSYHIFVVNLDSDVVRLHLYEPAAKNKNFYSLGAVKKYLETNKIPPLMITNAGMYTRDHEPKGLYIEENSKTFFVLDTHRNIPNTNFYLAPNGVFYIDNLNIPHIDTTGSIAPLSIAALKKFKLATQSGPMLLIHGNIHPAFIKGSKNLKVRSGVGLIKNDPKKIVFAITLEESNFYDFALFFHDVFNCDNALFLDGAISKMYLHDLDSTELGGNFGPMISVTKKR